LSVKKASNLCNNSHGNIASYKPHRRGRRTKAFLAPVANAEIGFEKDPVGLVAAPNTAAPACDGICVHVCALTLETCMCA